MASRVEFSPDQPGLNRLAKTHFVGDEQAQPTRCEEPNDGSELIWPEYRPGGSERVDGVCEVLRELDARQRGSEPGGLVGRSGDPLIRVVIDLRRLKRRLGHGHGPAVEADLVPPCAPVELAASNRRFLAPGSRDDTYTEVEHRHRNGPRISPPSDEPPVGPHQRVIIGHVPIRFDRLTWRGTPHDGHRGRSRLCRERVHTGWKRDLADLY